MINNDVLRSIRYMLNISEFALVDIVKLGGGNVTQADMNAFIKKEDEPGFVECRQNVMAHFLNGLIYLKRGRDESRPPLTADLPANNVVMKKLRVAFQLKDDDIVQLLAGAGFMITTTEINAYFRKAGHPNYRQVGDQILRYFLKGLTMRLRP